MSDRTLYAAIANLVENGEALTLRECEQIAAAINQRDELLVALRELTEALRGKIQLVEFGGDPTHEARALNRALALINKVQP